MPTTYALTRGLFCAYLQVDPGDVVMLVVSWHFDAAAMCEFSREEFVKGMTSLGCDSAEQLRRALPRLRAELNDSAKFKVHSPVLCPCQCSASDNALCSVRYVFVQQCT